MKIEKILKDNKTEVLNKWFDLILDTYPGESNRFFSDKSAEFTNPVGHTIAKHTASLFDMLLESRDAADISTALEEIIKIRAVQEFSPSQAVGFVFLLKQVVRDVAGAAADKSEYAELTEFEDRIDFCAMIAFDQYMKKREKLYEIKANEIRSRNGRMVQRLNRKYDFLEHRSDISGEDGLPEN